MISNFQQPTGNQQAAAHVTALGAFEGWHHGFASVGVAANVYTLVPAPGQSIDPSDASIHASARGTNHKAHFTHLANSNIEVRMFDAAGALQQAPFGIVVSRKRVG